MRLQLIDLEDVVTIEEVEGEEGVYQQFLEGKKNPIRFRRSKKEGEWDWQWTIRGETAPWASVGKAKLLPEE